MGAGSPAIAAAASQAIVATQQVFLIFMIGLDKNKKINKSFEN